jgi:hypothetical protein
MRALVFTCVAAVAWAQAPKATPQNILPQRVIDEYVRALGGAKALAQIRTGTIAGSLTEESTGKMGSYSLIVKAPNRYYSEIIVEPDRDVDAYNGMSAWGQDGREGVRTLTGAAAKEAEGAGQYWNSRLVDVKKSKLGVQLTGTEQVRGRDAYRMKVSLGMGAVREVFFDTQTHLIVRETGAGEQFDYEDYRAVNGIQTPYRIELRKGGHAYKISVTRAEFNAAVDNSVFDFPKTAGIPLPDMKALFLDVSKNQKTLEELHRQYTYHAATETEQTDSKGQTKSKAIREFEVFPIDGGGEVWHLLAKDGKPLEGDGKKKVDQQFNKTYEERTKEQAKKRAELAANPQKKAKEDAREEAEDEQDISHILRVVRFTNPRRERFRGQDVIAVDFGANPDYKPKSIEEHLAQSLAGVIWIDEQAHEMVRMEAHFSDAFKVAGGLLATVDKGSSFVFEQTRVNDEVWLPSYTEVHMGARFLLFKGRENGIQRFTDYKKFNAESKIIVGQP